MLVYDILDTCTKTNDSVVEEVVRLACAHRTVVLVVLVQHHTEVAVYTTLRQTASESLVRVEHLLNT